MVFLVAWPAGLERLERTSFLTGEGTHKKCLQLLIAVGRREPQDDLTAHGVE